MSAAVIAPSGTPKPGVVRAGALRGEVGLAAPADRQDRTQPVGPAVTPAHDVVVGVDPGGADQRPSQPRVDPRVEVIEQARGVQERSPVRGSHLIAGVVGVVHRGAAAGCRRPGSRRWWQRGASLARNSPSATGGPAQPSGALHGDPGCRCAPSRDAGRVQPCCEARSRRQPESVRVREDCYLLANTPVGVALGPQDPASRPRARRLGRAAP